MLQIISQKFNIYSEAIRRFFTPILFLLALLLAGFLHSYNSFYYPYFESDEGTYLSQAFAVKEYGELSLYTYWYDHPPFGWITIAAWVDILHGDWNFFGSSLNTGRVLMVLLHLIQVNLIFFLINRVTRSPWLAFLTIVLYSTSPLSNYFQRRVLLDNLLTTWSLLSVAILFIKEVKLRHIVMSAVFFGLSMITKITTVMFGPAIFYLLITAKWKLHRGFRTLTWLIVSGAIFSLWFIYAAINTELIPSPNNDRVSLIGSILYQASRGTGASFWQAESSFMDNMRNWMILDSTYVYIVGFGLLVALLLTIFNKKYRFFGMAAILYFIFIIRGGIVIGFYVLPMLPFVAMSIVLGLDTVIEWLKKRGVPNFVPVIMVMLTLIAYTNHYYPKVVKYLTVDETSNQIKALRWIKRELPSDSRIIIDINSMTELLDPSFENSKEFKNAEWYYKVAMDPQIRFEKYNDDWKNFDYILISHEMIYQSSQNELPVVYNAIRNSEPVMKWDNNSTAFVDIQKFISTNGDWTALHRINNNTRTQLLYAWNYFRDNFIISYGQVFDPQTETTTSEGQSYGMLRAVFMNDPETFKGVWLWTQHQLQHRLDDKLISWRWKDGKQIDSANATDADLDIALALIFASKRFDEPAYLDDAKELLTDIWEQTVVEINGRYYLLPMEKTLARRDNFYLLNPSYFSPAHYRIFAEVDQKRQIEWLKLADDTYQILKNELPTNWMLVNDTNGQLSSADRYITQGNADIFGYDAFRTFWRVGLDVAWYKNNTAEQYLESISEIFVNDWTVSQNFSDLYRKNGTRIRSLENDSVSAGILSALRFGATPQISAEVYNKLFVEEAVIDEESEYMYWKNPDNYYDLNWIWFGVGLYNNNLPNLWHSSIN